MTEGRGRTGMQGAASWAIGGLAAVAVVAGLVIAGGPVQARKERRDAARMSDLSQIEHHISCLVVDLGRRELPAELGPTPGCPGPVPLTDSRTGETYRIEAIAGGKYRLCAGFELPQGEPPPWETDRRDGDCLIRSLPVLETEPPGTTLPE